MCGVVKNVNNGMDDGGVEYVDAINVSGAGGHDQAGVDGGDLSEDR